MLDSTPQKTVTIKLDGKDISVPEGATIWEAAQAQGTLIPHLCHKPEPGYRSDGNCRACMVEIEGERVLAASCIRPVQDGMVVTVSSHEGDPISVELPDTVVMEVVEADAVVKGQTASSSYKPAILENGERVMVPPHIESGTRIVVRPEDASYVERAKN